MPRSKSQIRQEISQRRQGLTAQEHRLRSDQVLARLRSYLQASTRHAVWALYVPMRQEVDVRPLFAEAPALGATVVLPRIKGEELVFHRSSGADLQPGRFGIAEPPATNEILQPSMVLVPGLAFSRDFHRLGYGKGYYDRALSHWRQKGISIQAIGVAFDFQICDDFAAEPHDEPLDCILTESETLVRARA